MYRTLLVLGLTFIAVLCLLPTIWQPLPSWLSFLSGNRVSLGLDLQGGTHLVLTVDIDQAVVNSVEINADELRRELRKAGVKSAKVERLDQTTLAVTLPNDQRDKLGDMVGQKLSLLPEEVRRIKQSALEQSLETIRNRIDQFGVTEPVIQRQGDRDI